MHGHDSVEYTHHTYNHVHYSTTKSNILAFKHLHYTAWQMQTVQCHTHGLNSRKLYTIVKYTKI